MKTGRLREGLLVVLFLLLAVWLRLPLFHNASALLDADEAFNALAMRHLAQGDAFFLYYPGQNYQGITEGLVGLALVKLFGWSALSYKLAGFLFYAVFLVGLFKLTRLAFGVRAAFAALALAIIAAPDALFYSFLARGGHTAVLAAGAWMIHALWKNEQTGRLRWLGLFWFLAGFSYYTYRLSVVFIAPLTAYLIFRSGVPAGLLAVVWNRPLRTISRRLQATRLLDVMIAVMLGATCWVVLAGGIHWRIGGLEIRGSGMWAVLRWVLLLAAVRLAVVGPELGAMLWPLRRVAGWCGLAFFLGVFPVVLAQVLAPPESSFVFSMGAHGRLGELLRMLGYHTLPAILGYAVPVDRAGAWLWSRCREPEVWLGLFWLAVLGWALIRACVSFVRRVAGVNSVPAMDCIGAESDAGIRNWKLPPGTVLLLTAAAILAAYCASSFSLDETSSRYLLPLLVPLCALAAAGLVRLGDILRRRLRVLDVTWVLLVAVCAIQLRQDFLVMRAWGFLAPQGLQLTERRHPPLLAAQFLERKGIRAGYGNYWIAYPITFLTDERIVITPYHRINERVPPNYMARVRQDPNPVYVFLEGLERNRMIAFERGLEARHVPYDTLLIPGWLGKIWIYFSLGGAFPHDL